ncbi:MAG: hypothetical protein BGN99_18320 [Alphaproteobacteria bacterium 65-37]|nr:MAG: hypothetical protein BGN99_18320 [Alphaproteobacteria bacterium 65-37]
MRSLYPAVWILGGAQVPFVDAVRFGLATLLNIGSFTRAFQAWCASSPNEPAFGAKWVARRVIP